MVRSSRAFLERERSLLLVDKGKQSLLLSRGVKEMPGDLYRYQEVKEPSFFS